MCIRCGQPARDPSQLCPGCEALAPAAAGQAEAAAGQAGTAASAWSGLSPAALASAVWRVPPGSESLRPHRVRPGTRSRWGLTAAGFVGLVVVAVSAILGLATHGSARIRPGYVLHPAGATAGAAGLDASGAPSWPALEHLRRSAPEAPGVARFVRRYFAALSSHNYRAYQLLLASRERARQSPAAFRARYGATTETAVTPGSVTPLRSGQLAVLVSYVRHRAGSARGACTWVSVLHLARTSHGYRVISDASHPAAGCGRHPAS